MTVTSPDSTGSESGAGGSGYVQQHAYSGPTGPYGTQIAEVDMATTAESAVLGNCMFHLFLICVALSVFFRDCNPAGAFFSVGPFLFFFQY